jgi:histone H3/H4
MFKNVVFFSFFECFLFCFYNRLAQILLMSEFTTEPLRTMLKKTGAKRVSDKAAVSLANHLEEKTALLLKQADKLSKHAGRSTVMREDIKAARKIMEK